ncbi:hypothetical protein NLJ89_g1914 [Agrocybe chaxingu]|uniref:CCZ1/INTU/HSP4 first Longin domain-containing protein n=1 Tax=Agrocybe chaxingu TaxID=84603 RepID=A0A9W8MZ42_9AGAR|nr:hypothetical protein NLJ89_g1914 [Agrocybe chaxingu]
MNRIPPTLSYLTIYNPTLRPTQPVEEDDEDAEEQAHILFYTSRERAVSRDRMLRQIGLAKALISFAELVISLNDQTNRSSYYHLSKRMIMVSPEPNFWIHVAIEVAKVPRTPDPKSKAKSTGKPADKGKEKEKPPSPMYDYQDGSVHDGAIRAHIMNGYERFKLTHGSFTSILSGLGQHALELQLERFWTVWAWSWNIEESPEFGEDFGPLLPPCYASLIPILDEFAENLSTDIIPVIFSRQHIIPSTRFTTEHYPASLTAHLASVVPPKLNHSPSSDTLNTLASSVDTIRGRLPTNAATAVAKAPVNATTNSGGANFLGMPPMPAMNMNMDVRKWNWPGYLTFGKSTASKPSTEKSVSIVTEKENPQTPPKKPEGQKDDARSHLAVEVNTDALEDAIASETMSLASGAGSEAEPNGQDIPSTSSRTGTHPSDIIISPVSVDPPSMPASSPSRSLIFNRPPEESPPPTPPALPEFSLTRLHLAPFEDPTATRRTTIHYFVQRDFMLALIDAHQEGVEGEDSETRDLQTAAEQALKLFDDIESAIYDAGLKSISDALPSATKILQPQDRYLISTGLYTYSPPGFVSKSSHLFNAKAILDNDPDISEVFSRGQNPQHWHIVKRGIGGANDSGEKPKTGGEEVFMEVFRKETSLTDVDNVLAGAIRKSGLPYDPSRPR